MRAIFVILLAIIFIRCASKDAREGSDTVLPAIHVYKAFLEKNRIGCSKVFNSLEYIPLETSKRSIIGRAPDIYVDRQYIIVIAFRQILLYDRNNGRFIREIGKFGRGPNEYMSTEIRSYNERLGIVCARGWQMNKRIHYDLSGQVKEVVRHPYQTSASHSLDPNTFVGFIPNLNGTEKKKLVIFNSEGEVLRVVKSDRTFLREVPGRVVSVGKECQFFPYKQDLFFKEIYNDTVYSITKNGLSPEYIFETGGNTPSYEIKGRRDFFKKLSGYYQIQDLFETEDFLFYTLLVNRELYPGYFNKESKETYIGDYSNDGHHGFYDDIHNFVSFEPKNKNLANEVFGYIEASIIYDWFKKKSGMTKNFPNHIRSLEKIGREDNPIVVIATLKDVTH
ncbi:MAG: 6-bladed beta-propeller [Cytophagales bacterium]|nr:6-bladed beta-propeller [Cytophagales bacterium]